MKKRLLILIIAALAAMLCLTACLDEPIIDGTLDIKSIEIVDGSVPTQFTVGETPDFSGIVVKVVYNDGTVKELGYSDVTVSELDTTTAGKKTVSVTYNNFSVNFEVTVVEEEVKATVTSIKIVPGSISLSYYIGQVPDMSQLQVEAKLSDGTTSVLKADEYTYTAIDTSQDGETTFTVTYSANTEITDSVTVTVIPIDSISVVTGSVKGGEEYKDSTKVKVSVGGTIDTSEIQVLVVFKNGEQKIVNADELTVGTIDTSTYGTQYLSVTYEGITIQYPIEVVGPKSLTVNKDSSWEKVMIGGTLDTSKMTAYITYSDQTAKPVAADDLTIGEIDTSKVGQQSLKVSYNGLETTVLVEVVGVDTLTVVDDTVSKEIFKGDALDLGNIKVSVKYTDGTTASLGAEALALGSIDTNVAGEQKLSVTYLDKTVEYTVKVCAITSIRVEGINKVVQAGDPIDISNMVVKGIYNDSHETEITLTEGITTNIDQIDINKEEDKILEVYYTGEHGEFSANVVISATPPELTGIEIRSWNKTIGLGGVYNNNSINVYASYGNDTTEKITEFSVTEINTNVAGEVEFTVTYTEGDVTKTATAKVQVLPIAKIEVSGIPALVNKGEALNTSAVKVLVTFSDNSTREVGIADGVTVSAADTTTGGDKKLTVSYLGEEAEVSYHVKAVYQISIFGGSVDSDLRNGYAVDYSGLILEITYTNGTKEQKKASELTGVTYTGTEVNATSFGVTYEGATASMQLKLINIVSVSALNNTVPSTVLQGATMLYDSMKLTVIYDNGDVYLVGNDDPKLSISQIDVNIPGTHAVTFTYFGYTTSVSILVKGVKSVEIIEGVLTTINVGQELDTSKILVRVMYTDGTYFYADITSPYLEIGSIDTETEGTKTLVVKYQGIAGSIEIQVVKIEIDGLIFGALLPDELVARESYKKNFKDSASPYVVGDDNLFYFYLNVIQLDENDNVVDIDGKSIPTAVRVFLVNSDGTETELEGDALTSMVAFNSANNSYDFTEAAIGETFRLQIRPADESSYFDEASVTKSHTVTVVDGYNIYKAWELNVMTNSTRDITSGVFGDEGEITQVTVVDKFLKSKGITRPEKLASIVLHGNLDVKQSDVPPEYFYVDDKGVNQGMYDQLGVFHRNLSSSEKKFEIYGNYFSVYSYSLPCVTPNGVANNDDEYSASSLFRIRLSDDAHSYIRNKQTKEAFSEFVVNIRDIATRDNDPNSNDQSASERHMRGLCCYKVGETIVNMTNVNVDAYMTSMVVENMGSTVNLNKVKFYNAWQGHLFLWSKNEHQVDYGGTKQDTWSYIPNLKVNINDSFLAKCGGPVILAQAPEVDEPCEKTCGTEVVADTKSEIWTYVTGQEAWFVAVGQTQLAAQIRSMNPLIGEAIGAGHGFTSKGYIQGVETINMVMVAMGNRGTSLEGTTPNASFTRDGVVGMMSHYPTNTTTFQTPKLDEIVGKTGGQAPVFQTNKGGLSFINVKEDGVTPYCQPYNAEFYAGTGDYITLYYTALGAGIMMEYYHPAQQTAEALN